MRLRPLLLLFALLALPARAQFPDHPLRILGGFAAGGTSDLVARMVAEMTTPLLGQRVVVENRTGASSMLAAEAMVRGPHDGYTVFQCASLVTVLPELPGMRVPIDIFADLLPIANVAHSTQAMLVKADAPFRTVADFLAAARANPGQLTYGSSGIGSLSHLSGARLEQLGQIRLTHIPYRGAALALVDVMGGRTTTIITNLGDAVGQLRGGELRLLAFADALGSPRHPEVPLIRATVPGYEISGWFGICGPKDMPPAAVQAWQRAIGTGLAEPRWRERLAEYGLSPRFEDPAQFARTMQADRLVWRETIRAANIRAD